MQCGRSRINARPIGARVSGKKRQACSVIAWKECPKATNGETLSCDSHIIAWFVFWKQSLGTPIDFSFVFSPITSAAFEVWACAFRSFGRDVGYSS